MTNRLGNGAISLFVLLTLLLAACAPATTVSTTDTSGFQPYRESIAGGEIEWKTDPAKLQGPFYLFGLSGLLFADDATVVGVVDDPAALVFLGTAALWAVSTVAADNADVIVNSVAELKLFAEKAIAQQYALEAALQTARVSVPEFEIVDMPAAFDPKGGSITVSVPNATTNVTWLSSPTSCSIDVSVNGEHMNNYKNMPPGLCNLQLVIDFVKSIKAWLTEKLGSKAETYINFIEEVLTPYI